MQKLTPCLWFDTEGEEAAKLYTSIFPNSRITNVSHYGEAGPRDAGSVLTVEFELDGQTFTALNGGPNSSSTRRSRSRSAARTRRRSTVTGSALGEGGEHGPCGWLKDKFGVSWQIVPKRLEELLSDPDKEKSQRVMAAMLRWASSRSTSWSARPRNALPGVAREHAAVDDEVGAGDPTRGGRNEKEDCVGDVRSGGRASRAAPRRATSRRPPATTPRSPAPRSRRATRC